MNIRSRSQPFVFLFWTTTVTVMVVALLLALIFPAMQVSAQRGRPTRVPTLQGRPTLDTSAGMATANAAATSAAGAAGNLAATANVLLTQAADVSSNPDAIAATAEYLATQSGVDPAAVQATSAAIATAIYDYDETALTEEQWTALTTLLNGASVFYDWDSNSVTATVILSETAFNALIDTTLEIYGFEPTQVNADLVEGGIVFTVTDAALSTALSGTLVFYVELQAVEGHIEANFVWATLNGRDLPEAAVDELATSLEELIAEALSEALAASGIVYSIDELMIGETELTVTATVVFTE